MEGLTSESFKVAGIIISRIKLMQPLLSQFLKIYLKLEFFRAILSLVVSRSHIGQVAAGILNDRMPDFLKVWMKN